MSQADAPAADWYPDPSGRFQFRYWDGEAWTGHVSTDGKTDWDPPGDAPEDGGDTDVAAAEPVQAQSAQAQSAQFESVQADADHDAASAGDDRAADDQRWAPTATTDGPVEAASEVSSGGAPEGGTIEEGEPADTNLVANRRAQLDADVEEWLDEVAAQVEPRLSRIEPTWTTQPQAEAARACAYGLLLGHLAHLHPHMRADLSKAAEAHPSFTTLQEGSRLETLEQIARDPQRTAAWLGPLIGNEDPDSVRQLLD